MQENEDFSAKNVQILFGRNGHKRNPVSGGARRLP